MVIWRQWGNGPTRYVNLRRLGLPHMRAGVAAGSPTGLWAMSRHAAVQQALPNAYFDSLGLPRLSVSWNAQLVRTAVVRTRMPGGVTGKASEGLPMSAR